MPLGRSIVAVILAMAVALLPASGGTAFAAQIDAALGHDATTAVMVVTATDHAAPCDHGSSAVDDCGSIAVCALKCFTYAGLRLPYLTTPFRAACALPGHATDIVDSRDGAPPFRPPRA